MRKEIEKIIKKVVFAEIWNEFNATSGRLTTDRTDKMSVIMAQNIEEKLTDAICNLIKGELEKLGELKCDNEEPHEVYYDYQQQIDNLIQQLEGGECVVS